MLSQYLEELSHILDVITVSCSIGAYRFAFPRAVTDLLRETDEVLYQAKKNGRGCFVIRDDLEQAAENEVQK